MVSKCLKGIALKFKGIALKFSNCFEEISLGERLCLLGHLRWDRHCGSNKALFNYQVGMKSLRSYKSGSRRQLIRPTPAQCRINVSNTGPMSPCVRCLRVLLPLSLWTMGGCTNNTHVDGYNATNVVQQNWTQACTSLQSQKAVTAHLKSEQLLPFGFARHTFTPDPGLHTWILFRPATCGHTDILSNQVPDTRWAVSITDLTDLTLTTLEDFWRSDGDQKVFYFEIIIHVLVSSFFFHLNTYICYGLRPVYFFISFTAGTDTSEDGPRAERVIGWIWPMVPQPYFGVTAVKYSRTWWQLHSHRPHGMYLVVWLFWTVTIKHVDELCILKYYHQRTRICIKAQF